MSQKHLETLRAAFQEGLHIIIAGITTGTFDRADPLEIVQTPMALDEPLPSRREGIATDGDMTPEQAATPC